MSPKQEAEPARVSDDGCQPSLSPVPSPAPHHQLEQGGRERDGRWGNERMCQTLTRANPWGARRRSVRWSTPWDPCGWSQEALGHANKLGSAPLNQQIANHAMNSHHLPPPKQRKNTCSTQQKKRSSQKENEQRQGTIEERQTQIGQKQRMKDPTGARRRGTEQSSQAISTFGVSETEFLAVRLAPHSGGRGDW